MGCSNTTNKKNKTIIGSKSLNPTNNNQAKLTTKDKENKNDNNEHDSSNTDISDIPKTAIQVKVEAETSEKIYPIWVEKGVKIKIYVKGKWSLLPDCGSVNYKGYTNLNYKHKDIHIGALMGRVQGGKHFQVKDGMSFISDVSGPIYFFANSSNHYIQPSGALDVYIENVKSRTKVEIESLLGWDLTELDTTIGHNYLSDEEKEQYVLLNKLRQNPKEFARQYLIHLIDNGPAYKEIYEKLTYYPTSKLFKPSLSLYLTARQHSKDLGENGSTGHMSTNGEDLRARISKYADNPSYFGENCSFGTNDPLSTVITLLVDDGVQSRAHRANILNEGYNQVGISVNPHASYKWNCIQVFGCNIVDKKNLEI